ncbi:MAG TPA: hypothetical protein VHD56_11950 [Tepidisphaeraceae bacterium]|nr:hypothetical protein [Tepidisphaeraceae bacterium]
MKSKTAIQPVAPMADIVATAKQLRATRAACRQFLLLWAMDGANPQQRQSRFDLIDSQAVEPSERDWSILYRGSILDD